ncbi:hypothetical protein BDP27DRAFT_1222084 [Rhodocollybia butyracea]|uniref:Uncharacterized protein n=1 Tax=Rhodocollybia butyracea TaxID=206335 RepID=A0A9P5PX32_9AGAR|nr:hypothetical protein BDP27DRAFT_1222084 [Rhodocollybia butyracea]
MAAKSAQDVVRYVEFLYKTRYRKPRNNYKRPPDTLLHVLHVWKTDQPDQFCENLQLDPKTFDSLVAELQNDPIFSSGDGGRSQAPVEHQIAVALYHFGHYGNGASLQQVANWCGYLKGWIKGAMQCVMVAILHPEFVRKNIHPPTAAEKEEAKKWVESRSCSVWRDGYCMVDGTLLPLAERPFWYGESYFDRKCNYSLNFQVSATHILYTMP